MEDLCVNEIETPCCLQVRIFTQPKILHDSSNFILSLVGTLYLNVSVLDLSSVVSMIKCGYNTQLVLFFINVRI
jgi:hypothetical protein